MILIDNLLVNITHFPDKTFATRFENMSLKGGVVLCWCYDNDEEMAQIYFLTKHLQNLGQKVLLQMPYCPHARMDRVKKADEIFTLKYFCEFINSLNFTEVHVLDIHSSVAEALIDRIKPMMPTNYIQMAIDAMSVPAPELVLFYPDEGAGKRYSSLMPTYDSSFGIKNRNWRTGEITGYSVVNPELVKNKSVLIIDDICSKGGTFYYAAKELKAWGAKDIYLYVTHCENSIFFGSLFAEQEGYELIKHIYTTNSILRDTHKKITIMNVQGRRNLR